VDIYEVLTDLYYELNKGVYSPAWQLLVEPLAFRILGTAPKGPTYPVGPTGPTYGAEPE